MKLISTVIGATLLASTFSASAQDAYGVRSPGNPYCPLGDPQGKDRTPGVLVFYAPPAQPNFRTLAYDVMFPTDYSLSWFKFEDHRFNPPQTPLTFAIEAVLGRPTGQSTAHPYGDGIYNGEAWNSMPWPIRALKNIDYFPGVSNPRIAVGTGNASMLKKETPYFLGLRLTSKTPTEEHPKFSIHYVTGLRNPVDRHTAYDMNPCFAGVRFNNQIPAISGFETLPLRKRCLVRTHWYAPQWVQDMVENGNPDVGNIGSKPTPKTTVPSGAGSFTQPFSPVSTTAMPPKPSPGGPEGRPPAGDGRLPGSIGELLNPSSTIHSGDGVSLAWCKD